MTPTASRRPLTPSVPRSRSPVPAGARSPGRPPSPPRAAGLATALLSQLWLGAAGLAAPSPLAGQATSGAGEDAAAGGEALVSDVPSFRPVVPIPAFRRAVEAGTRTDSGVPGERYWQQRVSYRIEAELDPADATVTGSETVTYHNRSPDTLRLVLVNLYQNVLSEGVRRNRTVRLTGGVRLERVTVAGREARELEQQEFARRVRQGGGEPGYLVQETIVAVVLPDPLLPGDSLELGFDWAFRVPGPEGFRMGHIDRRVFNVAQWYPQVATYDDVRGFDSEVYLGDGEFYLEYGDFDVSLTVPEGWLVAATGRLENPEEVLTPAARRRLAAALASDTTVAVVTAGDREAGAATAGSEDGTLTWRFRAEDVRDVAFGASDRYVWDAVGADVGGERGRIPVHALYDPELEHWSEAAAYSRHSLEFFSDYLVPYPYPHATAVYGPVGGMEYPMLVFIGRSRPGEPLYSVLAHEYSHEWFPMLVGSEEAAYAWMDEGLTTFNESLARADHFGNEEARQGDLQAYLNAVRADVEAPMMEHTDHVENGFGRAVAAYMKPAVVLHALRTVLGEQTFDRAYRRYAEAWSWRHPWPWDFFHLFEAEAGRDLDWFWRQWFYETTTLDQALAEVSREDGALRVTVRNEGGGVMPVLLRIEQEDGSARDLVWPVGVWAGTRTVTRTVEVEGTPTRVVIDPDRRFPDVDRSDNVWQP